MPGRTADSATGPECPGCQRSYTHIMTRASLDDNSYLPKTLYIACPGEPHNKRLVLLVLACRAAIEGIAVIRRMSEPKTARPTRGGRGRTHSCGRPGVGVRNQEVLTNLSASGPVRRNPQSTSPRDSVCTICVLGPASSTPITTVWTPRTAGWSRPGGFLSLGWFVLCCALWETTALFMRPIFILPETTLLRFGTDSFQDHERVLSHSRADQLRNTRLEQEKSAHLTRRLCTRLLTNDRQ